MKDFRDPEDEDDSNDDLPTFEHDDPIIKGDSDDPIPQDD